MHKLHNKEAKLTSSFGTHCGMSLLPEAIPTTTGPNKRKVGETEGLSPTNTQRQKQKKGESMPLDKNDENIIEKLINKIESLETRVYEQDEYIDDLLMRVAYLEDELEEKSRPIINQKNFPELSNGSNKEEPSQQENVIRCTWGKKVNDILKLETNETRTTKPKLELVEEIKQERKIRPSIIAFGVEESTASKKEDQWKDDRKKVGDIFQAINLSPENIIKTFRFNKKEDKIPPIRILLRDENIRLNVLKTAPSLKRTEFNKVWLKPDLGEKELQEREKLKNIMNKQNDLMKDKFNNELKCIITKSNSLRIVLNEKQEETVKTGTNNQDKDKVGDGMDAEESGSNQTQTPETQGLMNQEENNTVAETKKRGRKPKIKVGNDKKNNPEKEKKALFSKLNEKDKKIKQLERLIKQRNN